MGDTPTPARRSRRRTILLIAAAFVAILVVLSAVAVLYTEVLWFREVGYSRVFRTMFWTRVGLAVAFGAVFAAALFVNVWVVRRIVPAERATKVPEQVLARYRVTLEPLKKPALVAMGVVAGMYAGIRASRMWREYLLWRHPTDFGTKDPLLHKDLGFFVFKLPFLRFVFGWTLGTLIVVIVVSALTHYVRGGIRPQRAGERVSAAARAHLCVLAGTLVLLKAWGYRLDQFDLLSSTRGVVQGAGYTDVHARLPALWFLLGAAVLGAAVLFAAAVKRRWRLGTAVIAALVVASIVVGGVYPAAVQRLKVKPDERTLETEYIKRNIDATRAAYGLGGVRRVRFPAASPIELPRTLVANRETVENIRLWAPDILQSVLQNLERGKQYYRFVSPADTDRYSILGSRRQVMIAAREISPSGLSPDAQTWVNTHLFYTHGHGVVLNTDEGITSQGQPDFVVRGTPMVGFEYFGTGSDSPIPTPQIYYGENEEVPFVIVRTDHGELDYPTSAPTSRTGYSTNRYDGSGGVQLDGLWKRAAFAWRFRDLNVLLSGAINDDSRIMMRRQVIKRVKAIAPFLSVDADPYIARDRGRLVWIVDAYTTASRYPYSQTANFARASNGLIGGSGNYIRDSVKFVVDAKNGTVDGYVWDDEDPVLRSWLDVFPGLFKPRSQMPATVAEHVEYAEALFGIQTDRFANYHVTDAGAFYQKENAWLIGRDPATCLNNPGACAGAGSPAVPPTYMLARFPGDADAHFLLVRPFTPGGSAGRQNLAGYLTASSDPRDYGRLISYEFGDDVFGPEQVQANINQDPAVSQQIALWNQQHSKVIYGNLVIVPVGNTLLYVQPLYLRGEGSQIPELKRVVVVANGRVEMADTLPDALTLLLGRG